MSKKKIEQLKSEDKGFKIKDIILYVIVIVVIVVLFLSIFLTRDSSPLAGIYIYYENSVVFTYDFKTDEYTLDRSHIQIEKEDESQITLIYFVKERTDKNYNTVYIDKTEKSADVIDADCSQRKDCFYMSKITSTAESIICSPHKMKIIPYGYELDGDYIPVG